MQECLDLVQSRHGQVDCGHLRVFAQQCKLEDIDDDDAGHIFQMRHFYPRTINITIRYTDTWEWERKAPLRFTGDWCEHISLPSSVSEFRMDFESLERRKGEVDKFATEIASKWHFRRIDGVNLLAHKSGISTSRWSGSSMLGGERWLRDEARPGQLDYYIATVTWRPSQDPLGDSPESNVDVFFDGSRPATPQLRYNVVFEHDLERADVSLNMTAEEAAETLAAAEEFVTCLLRAD